MGEGRGVYRVLVERLEGKRLLGRLRCRWEDNIKMDVREIGIDGANWIRLAQDRVHKGSRILFDKLSDNQLFKELSAP
jgi:hypothetical protein